jgi:hypothetical protein
MTDLSRKTEPKLESINEITIECIEKPNVCKDRYEFIKLGEKLQENQK